MEHEVHNNKHNQQYEVEVEGDIASLQYRFRKKTMFFMHTKVPEAGKGQGVGSAMAKAGLEFAKSKGFKIAILCPFVSSYVKKHREWLDLIDREYHQMGFR